MGRPRTRPPVSEAKAAQQRLRKLAQTADMITKSLCNLMVAQIKSIEWYAAHGEAEMAERVRQNLRQSTQRLAERMADAVQ